MWVRLNDVGKYWEKANTPTSPTSTFTKLDMNYREVFNVKVYGAIGDGATDDTTAIQAAINATNVLGPGGVYGFGGIVEMPKGSYKITKTLVMREGVTLRGVGKGSITGGPTVLDTTTIPSGNPGILINGDILAVGSNGWARVITSNSGSTGLTSSSTTATAHIASHGYANGSTVIISGAAQTEYNGTYTIAVPDGNHFTYTFAGSGTSPATTSGSIRDIQLTDFYLAGRGAAVAGTEAEIQGVGNTSQVIIRDLIVARHSGGSVATTGYCILLEGGMHSSRLEGIITAGGLNGFSLGASVTSTSLISCFAQLAAGYGYDISGTYNSLMSCATDSSGISGYILRDAAGIGLYSCGAEGSTRQSVLLYNSTGILISAFRSHVSNSSASTYYPSFLEIENSDYITVIGCIDSSPDAATVYSIDSTTSDSGVNIIILNCSLDKSVSARLAKQLVSYGANDSGGTGYRLLRIANS